MEKLMQTDNGCYFDDGLLCRYYRKWINNNEIAVDSLPPAFKYIHAKDFVIFNYKLFDHNAGIWFMSGDDTKYLFEDQDLGYLTNVSTELYLMNRMKVPFNVNHFLRFTTNDNGITTSFYNYKHDKEYMNPGKALKQLPWLTKPDDSKIEEMVNCIKAQLDPDVNFKIVSGEQIKYWYLGDRYAPNSGSLSASCMRYMRCQDYFGIYTENPIEMLIATDNNGQLRGRALLWPRSMWNKNYWDDVPYIMDRIYGTDHIITKFKKYAQERNWVYKNRQTYSDTITWRVPGDYTVEEKRCRMNLVSTSFDEYPYMDTFNRIVYDDVCLKNYGYGDILDSTEGYTTEGHSCNECGATDIHEDDWIFVNDERVCSDCTAFSEYDDTYYLNDDVRYSEPLSSYIHYEDAYEVTHGRYTGDYTHREDMYSVYGNDNSVVPECDACCGRKAPINFLLEDNRIVFELMDNEGVCLRTLYASDNVLYDTNCWDVFFQTMIEETSQYNYVSGISMKYHDIQMSFIYNDETWKSIIDVLTTTVEHFSLTYDNIESYATT